MKKTQGVEDLVREVLNTISEPYPENITDQVCLAIENNPNWTTRYKELSDELGEAWIVNNWIEQYTAQITGLKSSSKQGKPKSNLITSYTKLIR